MVSETVGPRGERALAVAALRVGAALTVPLLGAGYLLGEVPGLLTAAAALAFICLNLALSAALLGWAAGIGPGAVVGVLFGGFLARMAALAVAFVTLQPLGIVHGEALALTVVVGLIVLLAYEAYVATRHEELWWVVDGRERG